MYTLHVNQPGRPPGSRVYVPGLGTFDNGSTNEVDQAHAERAFKRYPRLYGAVEGTDIFVGEKPAQVPEAAPVAMHALDFPVEENEND